MIGLSNKKVYLNTIKLLQEGKITQEEFEKLKSLSSIWNTPYIYCILTALIILWTTSIIAVVPLSVLSLIDIPIGLFIIACDGYIVKRKKP